jgi:hypothetical protein
LTSCKDNADYSNKYNWETDYQYLYRRQGLPEAVTYNGDGYYFLTGDRIYYADKDNMEPVVLNNRPDADYDDAESAYFTKAFNRGFITFNNGKLYVLEMYEKLGDDNRVKEPARLIEMEKDGTGRKTVLTFDFFPESIAIHRGCVYYTVRDFSKKSDLEYYLMKYDMDKSFSSEPEVIYEGNLLGGKIADVFPYGNNVYFHETGDFRQIGKDIYRAMRYDIKEETVARIIVDDDDSYMYPSIVGILNNKLLVSMYDGDDNYEKEWFKYVSDLEGTDVEKLPIDINFISNIYSDENYLFLRPVNTMANLDEYSHIKNEMAIYDLEYNLVDKVDMSKYIGISQLVSGDDDYMFIFYTSDLTTFAVDYLDKKEIGSGNLEFKNLIGN